MPIPKKGTQSIIKDFDQEMVVPLQTMKQIEDNKVYSQGGIVKPLYTSQPLKIETAPFSLSPAKINSFLVWIESLDVHDPKYRDQAPVIRLVKKDHNRANVRHTLDLLQLFEEETNHV